jgi:DNA polymerase-3 subunit chi
MSQKRADFYLLSHNDSEARITFLCRIIEKAYLLGHKINVFCPSKQEAEAIDEALWTFKPQSFIPHHIQGEGPTPPPPVQISFEGRPTGHYDILMNLTPEIPAFYSQFNRIIEVILNDDPLKEIARQHYRSYRSWGYIPHLHEIEGK